MRSIKVVWEVLQFIVKQQHIMEFLVSPPSQDHYRQGIKHYQNKQYAQAVVSFTTCIEQNVKLKASYIYRGLSYNLLEKYQKAVDDYTSAINIDPNYSLAYYNRALTYKAMGNNDEAINDYTRTINIDPTIGIAHQNRGLIYFDKGRYDDAIADYNVVIKIDPNYAFAYNNRGVAHSQNQYYDRAEKDYITTLDLLPNYPIALFNLANCQLKMNQKTQAKKNFQRGIHAFTRADDEELKDTYKMTDENIKFIKYSINEFKSFTSEIERVRTHAREKGRQDLLNELEHLEEDYHYNAIAQIRDTDNGRPSEAREKNKKLSERLIEIEKELNMKPMEHPKGSQPLKRQQPRPKKTGCCGGDCQVM